MIKWANYTIGRRRKYVQGMIETFPSLEDAFHRLTFLAYRNKLIRFCFALVTIPAWFPVVCVGAIGGAIGATGFAIEIIGRGIFSFCVTAVQWLINVSNKFNLSQDEAEKINEQIFKANQGSIISKGYRNAK